MADPAAATEGPWFVQTLHSQQVRVVRGRGGEVARLSIDDPMAAELIAAAPDLCEALAAIDATGVLREAVALLEQSGVAVDEERARRIRLAELRTRHALARLRIDR